MKNNISRIALVVSNLIPLFGVIFLSWDLPLIMITYWMETVIIGIINIFKIRKAKGLILKEDMEVMTGSTINGKSIKNINKNLLVSFFILHYGLFTIFYGGFMVLFFGVTHKSFIYISVMFVLTFVSHFVSYKINYIEKGEYLNTYPGKLFFQPYSRIIIMHLTIIFGGWLMKSFGSSIYALAVMIILKIIIDLRSHNKEHNKFAGIPVLNKN